MSDGGRNAAWGFFFQYVRTLEAFLDVVDLDSVRAVYVEGRDTGAGQSREVKDQAGLSRGYRRAA